MAPVTNGQFSFNVDTFYVATSGGQIHRRAAPAEIKALYDTSTTDKSIPDHPGHWYEAQLLHYGLLPSKLKATAKMRLLKAVQDGGLTVPKESQQIEKNLKKEWKKQDLEEQPQANTKTTTTKTVTTKTITVSKTVASKTTESKTTASKTTAKPVATKAAAKPAAVKPAATKAATPKSAPSKKDTAANTVASKATAAKTAAAKPADKPTTTKAAPKAAAKPAAVKAAAKTAAAKPATPKAAPKKATAPKTATAKATPAKSVTPQTAAKRKRASNDEKTPNQPQTVKRRVYGKKAQGDTDVPTNSHPEPSGWSEQPEYEDAPPSYEFACRMDGEHLYDALDDQMDIDYESEFEAYSDPPSPPRTLKKTLGLLNGTYQVRSSHIEYSWPHAMPSEGITLSLRLNGNEIWGAYEFGAFEGVLWMPDRPMRASFDRVPFKWRGRETGEGEMSFEDDQEGWIEFLGDGDIVGMINCCGELHFRGQRIDSFVRTASDLRDEWDGYNEEQYEQERRGRWGRW
ncbi:unnamed protein product [Penicillium nalgiovense]|uniref:Uncharacterized protein n=1 Tax=Penicillium nalgiovense TaxID=60175 RepID=A0A9W4HU13_PENNA|nr:unnamed protein product [Penicillium nalgiovense]CAG8007357.1 unnamed protein product [Penicillium nalgiovense]CAG8053662.1 unnamed protein product [Penicillium nalgiovense]CAG8054739.1 unnamed protein product [Penicillium nalgiovense]CAG8115998.1 unnamed protein product [Penicillium nalgiovense]